MRSSKLLRDAARLRFVEKKSHPDVVAELKKLDYKIIDREIGDVLDEAVEWLLHRDEVLQDREFNATVPGLQAGLRAAYPFLVRAQVLKVSRQVMQLIHAATAHLSSSILFNHTAGLDLHVSFCGGDYTNAISTLLPLEVRPAAHFHSCAIIGHGIMPNHAHKPPEWAAALAWMNSGSLPGHLHYSTLLPPLVLPDFSTKDKAKLHQQAKGMLLAEAKEYFEIVRPMLRGSALPDMVIGCLSLFEDGGVIDDSTMTGLLQSRGVNPDLLIEEGACGAIGYCIFDENGEGRPDWEFIITPGFPKGLKFYRGLVRDKRAHVLVVGCIKHVKAMRAALKGKLFNSIITDEETAKALITYAAEDQGMTVEFVEE